MMQVRALRRKRETDTTLRQKTLRTVGNRLSFQRSEIHDKNNTSIGSYRPKDVGISASSKPDWKKVAQRRNRGWTERQTCSGGRK